jgi:hypothetical protein
MRDAFKEDMDCVGEGGGSMLLFKEGFIFGR